MNTTAIQQAIDELKADVARKNEAIATLERLIGGNGVEPKNRGGVSAMRVCR